MLELQRKLLRQHAHNEGNRVLEIPLPSTVELPEPLDSFGRMVVAWGLSYPPTEIGQINSMRDIEDIPPPAKVDRGGLSPSKEEV
ncbi:MAG: hypothetical protein OXF68_13575 [Gammaproteobacteria bacterium]|nr:hypothetical protein [Gammaproteobacteria bacterium]